MEGKLDFKVRGVEPDLEGVVPVVLVFSQEISGLDSGMSDFVILNPKRGKL